MWGYFDDILDADSYFSGRFSSAAWDVLSDTDKEKSIANAYNNLYFSSLFGLPTSADATEDQKPKLKAANAEMAYFLIVHQEDMDSRLGLISQGVTESKVVGEKYSKVSSQIPSIVKDLLSDYSSGDGIIHTITTYRSEEG